MGTPGLNQPDIAAENLLMVRAFRHDQGNCEDSGVA